MLNFQVEKKFPTFLQIGTLMFPNMSNSTPIRRGESDNVETDNVKKRHEYNIVEFDNVQKRHEYDIVEFDNIMETLKKSSCCMHCPSS